MIDNDKGEQGFEIIFKNPVDSPYKITYKTSVKDVSLVQSSYKNTATVYDGEKKETDLNASVSIPNGDTYTAKSGKQNGKVIDWKININFGQSTVQKARILDTPSPNQMLIKDSFKLYSTTVEANGNVKKKEELTEGKDYVLTLKENRIPSRSTSRKKYPPLTSSSINHSSWRRSVGRSATPSTSKVKMPGKM